MFRILRDKSPLSRKIQNTNWNELDDTSSTMNASNEQQISQLYSKKKKKEKTSETSKPKDIKR